jgi:hypothetical protein
MALVIMVLGGILRLRRLNFLSVSVEAVEFPIRQPTAAPVSGKKPPPSRCALSRWSKPVRRHFRRSCWNRGFVGGFGIQEKAENAELVEKGVKN